MIPSFKGLERAAIGFVILACLVSFAIGLSACSTTPDGERRDRLGVQVATMALIERADAPRVKAADILEVSGRLRTDVNAAVEASVGDLRATLLAIMAERYTAGKLSPLERLAALEFINTVADGVERRVGSGLLTPETRVKVNTVLTWIEDAARTYVSNPS